FSALALAELARRAGIPDGVFNVVTGSASAVGNELTGNPLVRKLSFTGSTEIGRQLMAQCAQDIKKVSLELGGNAPFIVFDDADLDKAVEGAMASKFRNAGQTCVCANRLYVQDGVYARFAEKLQQAVEQLHLGDGLQAGVTTGPLIDEKAIAKVQEHIADAVGKGARVITGGKVDALGGNFFQPTILVDVPDGAKVAKEETFGPLAPLFRFTDEADVIRQANDTEFGLAAYFYARDLSRVFRVGEALEYGIVGINTGLISNEVAPFGGVKASGLGREGSKYGIEDYLEIKYMCIGL
ncbi:TPA: aldehyde dehydrogenase family protein, partial [Raoultella ornithinolytica]|nr:aldehyde dehydrogenase family protein [Raoultella ornithinolytica]